MIYSTISELYRRIDYPEELFSSYSQGQVIQHLEQFRLWKPRPWKPVAFQRFDPIRKLCYRERTDELRSGENRSVGNLLFTVRTA